MAKSDHCKFLKPLEGPKMKKLKINKRERTKPLQNPEYRFVISRSSMHAVWFSW